ncbi:MAG TPA: hypothetical protein VGH80_07110 [Xanthomonadaceae bacterium]|jgi:hypothetical protein
MARLATPDEIHSTETGVREVSFTMTVQFEHPVKLWVLQMGGWLPLPFWAGNVLLIDRNVTSKLSALAQPPGSSCSPADRWWLDHLNSESLTINPLLCAIEGSKKAVPSFEEFRDEFESASRMVLLGLPKARLLGFDYKSEHFRRVYSMVESKSARHVQEMQFLVRVAPMLVSRLGKAEAHRAEADIIQLARSQGVALRSLAMFCVLSCLYEPQDGSPPRIGRGVLKPRATYTDADAHNALSDIRSLELLAAFNGLGLGTAGFCTRDKHLAAFWCALDVSNPRWQGRKFDATLTPSAQLFPRLDARGIAELVERLQ